MKLSIKTRTNALRIALKPLPILISTVLCATLTPAKDVTLIPPMPKWSSRLLLFDLACFAFINLLIQFIRHSRKTVKGLERKSILQDLISLRMCWDEPDAKTVAVPRTRELFAFNFRRPRTGLKRPLYWGQVSLQLLLCTATLVNSSAQTFTNLLNFDGTNGANPASTLVQGMDGNFYGTTEYGGSSGSGTVFQVTPAGVLTVLHSFESSDGANPLAGLVLAPDGSFYGTTSAGGNTASPCDPWASAQGCGTIFRITPTGEFTTLYSFDVATGAEPQTALVLGSSGDFYGTTFAGGPSKNCPGTSPFAGCGTVFKITPAGSLTTLVSLNLINGQGAIGGLIQARNGNFYGSATQGGAGGKGALYQVTPGGVLTDIHAFDLTDGDYPNALMQATSGTFYGTTAEAGAYGWGTVFAISPAGVFTTLHNFDVTDGETPVAGLIEGTDHELYGTTAGGGASEECFTYPCYGTIFRMTPEGDIKTLHSFDFASEWPMAALVQGTDGSFYGTTHGNSSYGSAGTIFRLSVGLSPFVRTLPMSGKVGDTIKILGTDLTGVTAVTFDGTPAPFTLVSPTEITTMIPAGASSGTVQVVTPGSTLSSNLRFEVRQ